MASSNSDRSDLKQCDCTDYATDTLKSLAVLAGLFGVLLLAVFFL